MARIFISYSRVDRYIVEDLSDKLRRLYGHDNVWFDEGLHGGDIWWEEILDEIAARDIFVYVLSNESVQSEIALNQWMFPVRTDLALPNCYDYAIHPSEVSILNTLMNSTEIAANLQSWLDQWDSIMTPG